jgi:hypothetical protein
MSIKEANGFIGGLIIGGGFWVAVIVGGGFLFEWLSRHIGYWTFGAVIIYALVVFWVLIALGFEDD